MSRLTTVIAHEVNNPLQAIVNTLQLLGRPLEPAKHERYLMMATEEAERLARTLQRALALYQPAREGRRAVGLHTLLERVIDQMHPLCLAHQIVIERDFSTENLHIIGVVSHLREVFLSLIQNAIDASKSGGRVLLRTKADLSADSVRDQIAIIEVIDQGTGIPADQLHHIFEPFYTTKNEQAGMGLSICYDIIEHHAGRLTVSSSDAGTTFHVSLPLASTLEV
jgi:two-component system, NtrC family, sensor kinase